MKKLIQIAVLIVIAVSTVKAQKVSQEIINKAVDKLNCLATENSVIESKKTWKCDCSSNPGYDKIKGAIPNDLSNTLALSNEINQIKNQKVPAASKDELIKYLSEDVFTKQSQFARLYSFASSRASNSAFKEWKRKLKSEISEIAANATNKEKKPDEEIVQEPPVQEPPVVEQVVNTSENKAESVEDKREPEVSKSVFTFEIDVVAIILMILLGIVIIKLSNSTPTASPVQSKRDIPDSIRNYVKEKIESASFTNRGSINTGYSSNEISRLKDEIFQLKKEIESLNQKVYAEKIPFEVIQPKYEDPNSETRRPTNENKTSNEAIYLSTPNNEGSFNDSSSSTSYREGASIYKFVKSSSNEASFQIDDRESSIKMAMQFPEKNILPVCDSENEYEPKYSKVKTIEPGKVSLEGGKWNVKRKAKIRYES
jgi:uncharacterized protein YdcH (DUF465 family)